MRKINHITWLIDEVQGCVSVQLTGLKDNINYLFRNSHICSSQYEMLRFLISELDACFKTIEKYPDITPLVIFSKNKLEKTREITVFYLKSL